MNWSSHRVRAGAVTVVLAAVVTAVVLAPSSDRAPVAVPDGRTAHSSGERLIPELGFVVTGGPDEPPPELDIPFFEVFPDGTVGDARLPVPDDMALSRLRTLPDGRALVLATQDLMPDVERRDGPSVEGIAFPLLVVDRGGHVVSTRDVRVAGELTGLVGATPTEAVLQRYAAGRDARPGAARIVAHDLETGRERPLWSDAPVATHGDMAGQRLVLAGGVEGGGVPCWLALLRLGSQTAARMRLSACDQIVGLDVAPDASSVAVVYERATDGSNEARLTTIDLERGSILADESLSRLESCTSCAYPMHAGYLGMAWSSDDTLTVASMDSMPTGIEPERALAEIQSRLRVQSHTVTSPR